MSDSKLPTTLDEWQEWDEVAAYFIWEKRTNDGLPGSALDDWLAGMDEIAKLTAPGINEPPVDVLPPPPATRP